MILEQGDMWSVFGKSDLFLITTNPIVRKDGAIVMGRGIASQARDRFPDLPYHFAGRLGVLNGLFGEGQCLVDSIGEYENQLVGFFMVKDHWAEDAKLPIITRSVQELMDWLSDEPFTRVDLNFPGIGNGKLKREDVLPVIEQLPDNVHVWEFS
jgi:hypothetical protein